MQLSAVNDWLDGEVVSFFEATTLVDLANPDAHVDLVQSRDDYAYPFVGIRPIATPSATQGLGNGNQTADDATYDDNGVLQSITYRRDATYRLELAPLTDGDRRLRDDMAGELVDHFALLVKKDDLPDDVSALRIDDGEPGGRPDEYVYGTGIPLEVDFQRYTVDDDPQAAESVDLDVTVSDDDDPNVGDTTDPTAFSESF